MAVAGSTADGGHSGTTGGAGVTAGKNSVGSGGIGANASGGSAGTNSGDVAGSSNSAVGGRGGFANVAAAGAAAGEPMSGGAAAGGTSSTGGQSPSQSGAAGAAGNGATVSLEAGTARIDLQVTAGDRSVHLTTCMPHSPTDSSLLAPYANGNREGQLICAPPLQSELNVFELGIVGLTGGLGTHDASELTYDCTGDGGCTGVGYVLVFENANLISSKPPTRTTGTFTLDDLDDGGRMSGSLDLTLTNGAVTVSVKGTFEANLLDCTTFPDQKCPSKSALE